MPAIADPPSDDPSEAFIAALYAGLRDEKPPTAVTIVPHSFHPDAVKATVATLEMLQMAGFKYTGQDDDGNITGTAVDAKFLEWAAVRQGYVAGITSGDSTGGTG